MTTQAPISPRNFITLDGLRGIAALAIAVRHAPFLWESGYPPTFLHESYLSVDFFFVLSGFVLAHAYGGRLRSGLGFWPFMKLRLVRFSPLYWLSAMIGVAASAGGFLAFGQGWAWLPALLADLALALLWVPTPFNPAAMFPLNSPAWSLFQELIANALLVLTGTAFKRCIPVMAAAGAGLVTAVWLGWFGFGAGSGAMDAGSGWASFPAGLLRGLYSFFAGIIAYRLWLVQKPRRAFSPLFPAAALCALLVLPGPPACHAAYDLLLSLLLFPLLVYAAAGTVPGPLLAALFAWLGRVSYGVYVLQMPIFVGLHYYAGWATGRAGFFRSELFAGLGVLLVAAAATLLERCYDVPFRRFLSRLGS